MLVDCEPSLLVEREAVGTGLIIFTDVQAAVAALRHKNGELSVLGPTIDQVVVGIAEKKVAVGFFRVRDPYRSFGKQKPSSQFLDLCSGRNDLV